MTTRKSKTQSVYDGMLESLKALAVQEGNTLVEQLHLMLDEHPDGPKSEPLFKLTQDEREYFSSKLLRLTSQLVFIYQGRLACFTCGTPTKGAFARPDGQTLACCPRCRDSDEQFAKFVFMLEAGVPSNMGPINQPVFNGETDGSLPPVGDVDQLYRQANELPPPAEIGLLGSPSVKYPDVTVDLAGVDGNVLAVIEAVTKAMKHKVPADEIAEFRASALDKHSYDEVLVFIMDTVNVEMNESDGEETDEEESED